MESQSDKITSFIHLDTWREAHQLVLMVYEATKRFPREEMFGLTNQMRRAVVSVSSNVAEGFTRRSALEKAQFYSIAQASNTELQNQLLVARDVGYLKREDFPKIANQSVRVGKLISGMIRHVRKSGQSISD